VTIFDLVFIVVFLMSVVVAAIVAIRLLRGRRREAVGLLRLGAIGLAGYLAVVVIVSLVSPRRVVALGENRCSDDWCIAVAEVVQESLPGDSAYRVTFRLSSRARGMPQRETGIAVYLVDEAGHRFNPDAEPSSPPFDVRLQPGEAVVTSRRFHVSGQKGSLGVIVAHEGSFGFPGCFIIGDEGSLLHKRSIVRVP
jgi:hypothetical protein